jgi:D-3-phosphoglycerate dehydrogenase
VHVLGIRSKTQVTAAALKGARRLLAIGCFCIGTNQVDLQVRAKFAFNHLLYSRSC